MYDIIGDVHGRHNALTGLLDLLGYVEHDGQRHHPDGRRALFIGDLIDKGSPEGIAKVVRLVHRMAMAGSAVVIMGNHEFNAIGMHTRKPGRRDEADDAWVRPRTKMQGPEKQTLLGLGEEYPYYLDWFRSLPWWLDLPGLRAVHACWSPSALAVISESRKAFGCAAGPLNDAFVGEAFTEKSELWAAVECVLKGVEVQLPDGVTIPDYQQQPRSALRIQWFRQPDGGERLNNWALPQRDDLGDLLVGDTGGQALPYPESAPPCFFGHYQVPFEQCRPIGNTLCVDLKDMAQLAGYRHDDGPLNEDRLIIVEDQGTGPAVIKTGGIRWVRRMADNTTHPLPIPAFAAGAAQHYNLRLLTESLSDAACEDLMAVRGPLAGYRWEHPHLSVDLDANGAVLTVRPKVERHILLVERQAFLDALDMPCEWVFDARMVTLSNSCGLHSGHTMTGEPALYASDGHRRAMDVPALLVACPPGFNINHWVPTGAVAQLVTLEVDGENLTAQVWVMPPAAGRTAHE